MALNVANGADDAPELVGDTPIGVWALLNGVDRCVELLMASPTRADGGGIMPKPIVITEPYLEDTKWKTNPPPHSYVLSSTLELCPGKCAREQTPPPPRMLQAIFK